METANASPVNAPADEHNQVLYIGLMLAKQKLQRVLYFAYIDIERRLFLINSFLENSQFQNLETLMMQLNPESEHTRLQIFYAKPDVAQENNQLLEILEHPNVKCAEM